MPRAIGVQVFTSFPGLEAIQRTAKKRAVTLKAVKAGAKLVQQRAKPNAPKRSGALRQSIGIKSQKGSRGKTLALAVIGARSKVTKQVRGKTVRPAKYAHLVEKGTKRSAAKPFLKPALDSQRTQISRAMLGALAAEIAKVMARESAKALAKLKR
ncbi:MAG TPA: HK97-gp10 family putative phage morphogenesis protein [Gemmata sp.]